MSGFTKKVEYNAGENWESEQFQFDMNSGFGSPEQTGFAFQNFDQHCNQSYNTTNSEYLDPNMSQASFVAPPPQRYGEDFYLSARKLSFTAGEPEEEDLPLLEELGIDLERIQAKTLASLNPFRPIGPTDDISFLLHDSDLAGPLVFCLVLGCCLLFSGKAHFGYVYGLALTSCIVMYVLLSLMSSATSSVTFISVSSILGYCILPIVGLSALGVFISLRTPIGMLVSLLAVAWCSLSSSRLFVIILSEVGQRSLIAYPCALLYGAFALIAIF